MKMGYYRRQKNRFTEHFGTKLHPIEKDRYILFWAKGGACLSCGDRNHFVGTWKRL